MTQTYTLYNGDCTEELRKIESDSVDSCVTDPPYGLSKEPDIAEVLTKWLAGETYDHGHGGFMGKAWDSFVPHPDIWREVYRVLKPGGYALVFAGTRTQDLMTVSLRMAGFEVRDVIEWLYFSGFPKSMDVGKAFDKRAGITGDRVEASGVGFMNAEGKGGYNVTTHRIEMPERTTELAREWDGWGTALKPAHEPIIVVRKPLRVDGRNATVADNVERYGTGGINIGGCRVEKREGDRTEYGVAGIPRKTGNIYGEMSGVHTYDGNIGRFPANAITTDDDAFYSPYFNVSPAGVSKKASKRDRGEGNTHPTVKPSDLMAWLIRLVTPPGGTVVDPFAGSGSTLVAAKREGFGYIGIEREADYIEIIEARTGEAVRESVSV